MRSNSDATNEVSVLSASTDDERSDVDSPIVLYVALSAGRVSGISCAINGRHHCLNTLPVFVGRVGRLNRGDRFS